MHFLFTVPATVTELFQLHSKGLESLKTNFSRKYYNKVLHKETKKRKVLLVLTINRLWLDYYLAIHLPTILIGTHVLQ